MLAVCVWIGCSVEDTSLKLLRGFSPPSTNILSYMHAKVLVLNLESTILLQSTVVQQKNTNKTRHFRGMWGWLCQNPHKLNNYMDDCKQATLGIGK